MFYTGPEMEVNIGYEAVAYVDIDSTAPDDVMLSLRIKYMGAVEGLTTIFRVYWYIERDVLAEWVDIITAS
jgi:hypothetical protein